MSRILWQGYGARHPTWRSEFTHVTPENKGIKIRQFIGITDYERYTVVDGSYTAFSVSMLEDGNGTVQREVDERSNMLEGVKRLLIGMPDAEPRKRHCGRWVTGQRPTEVEWLAMHSTNDNERMTNEKIEGECVGEEVRDMRRPGGRRVPAQFSEKRGPFIQTRTRRRCGRLRWGFYFQRHVV
jgi:hypothetical protein